MNNNVIISLGQAENLFQTFKEKNDLKKLGDFFRFDQSKSINENLNRLSLFALHNSKTLAVFYSFKTLFLELIARWISNTMEFEREFNQIYNDGNQNHIKGSIVTYALSTVVGLSNESIGLIEYFLHRAGIFSQLSSAIRNGETNITSIELESILLAFYRLTEHDSHRFKVLIVPGTLHNILSLKGEEFNVSKYLSIKLLSTYLDASEESERHMIQTHLNTKEPLQSTVDYESEIHFEFLSLHESKRLSNFTSLPPQPELNVSKKNILIEDTELNPLVKSVCGVLVPNLLQKDSSTSQLAESSSFVPTDNSIRVLRQLASYIQNNQPTLLYGKAGSGKTFLINQLAKYMNYEDSIVKIHLGEQTDAKLLLGTYSSGEKPGTFQWRSGILTTAVKEGKWVLIEDIDKAPTEVLSVLLTLLEKRELSIPSRGEIIKAKNGFQLISTIRVSNDTARFTMPDLIGMRLWKQCKVEIPSEVDLRNILVAQFPLLKNLIHPFIKCYNEITRIYSLSSFITLNKGSHPRVISFRDLMKFCARCNMMLFNEGVDSSDALLESSVYDNIFAEAVDCFGSAITENGALVPLINTIGESLEIPTSRINLFLSKHIPQLLESNDRIKIGRATLTKSKSIRSSSTNKGNNTSFARTNHSLRLMEQIGVSIQMAEPLLLVGETGTGKTTVVQEVAKMMNKKLTVINVSQQTESGDLLGGYKPVNTKTIAVPLQEIFEELFSISFSKKKNEKFSQVLSKCFNRSQWKNVTKLWREAVRMAKDILSVNSKSDEEEEEGAPKKKRKLRSAEKVALIDRWRDFEIKIKEFEIQSSSLDNSFVFSFVEGSLVKAVRNGDWLLLDEINLASSDTLESIADLLSESLNQRSILLAEKGDIDSIKAHPEFRIFGCMNPSTDVGKRDLPPSIRSRFSEIYVHSPDKDMDDLLSIIDKYLNRYSIGDEWVVNDIAELYTETKKLAEANKIVDGANQKPHFSIRTLTRTLIYVRDIVSIYGLRRSLYEGFCMAFLTLLDIKSEKILKPLIEKYTINKLKNAKSVMSQSPPIPANDSNSYVQFKHYWMKRGPGEIIPQPHYIITPFVEKNMLNLVRATAGRRFPVLIQGPTSAGKTSMIKYLANITGHEFVRINNHEHTDLQEYLGTYVSDTTGKLTFREGVLVEALRKGHWIVLDELNLAPTDVLEALNRLLDDNRELFIPETQEVVHPHPDFMIFATQNPPGMYGGRKVLSRAFRNRFLELHFDDIPQDELESILRERCQIAPSYGKKIVEVYRQLSIQRQSTRLFEQKNSFATLRDLFRWALRDAVGYEELAANGYMLLAERVRKEDEKKLVKETIEKVMKVKLDMDAYYSKLENEALVKSESSIVWTKAMRRLAVLVATSIKYNEPLLLVGETGCGKTTVCQILAQYLGKELVVVNAHQNTETGDILGAQRPVRNRFELQHKLYKNITNVLESLNIEIDSNESLENLVKKYDSIENLDGVDSSLIDEIKEDKRNYAVLFEWNDGPLIHAMKEGNFFLLDEISLADDSVLERLNSVLEPERSLLLAEKGTEDAFITAHEGFQFLATMNPGGDYGKKELSPALRNRFTEIWVPSMEDFNDVKQIVSSKLHAKGESLSDAIIQFSQWFGEKYGGSANSGVISLRDILAWVQFINSSIVTVQPELALLHGASMVFIDALGTNNTAYLAENEIRLNEHKLECVRELSKLVNSDLVVAYAERFTVVLNDKEVQTGPFSVPRVSNDESSRSFNLSAPTTAMNAMRVIRAMQVHKPILLEGSPGVGKTSLISALAKATGNKLVRLNLSEQTDLVDLFGSDAPAEGGKMGEFVWRDAPFLRAMQKGEWVLLDEMNLASQAVLEGLNSCLDHRGEAYIPELDRSFPCHPDFTVFAAQNPQYQGGGRKGLPKSFINRFTVVYVDVLKSEDLKLISRHLYPNIDTDVSNKMIEFVSKLEEETVIKKLWGSSGGPWEFNLRDTLRWLDLLSSRTIEKDIQPNAFFDMIVGHRFRTSQDKNKAIELFESIFGPKPARDNYYHLGDNFIQAGGSIIKRKELVTHNSKSNLVPLQCNFQFLETAIRCINVNLPLILTGPTNSGKTELIRLLAGLVGAKLDEFAMNSDVDSMDILGGYEQVDLTRKLSLIVSNVRDVLVELVIINLQSGETNVQILSKALELLKYIDNNMVNVSNYDDFNTLLESYVSYHSDERLIELLKQSETLKLKLKEEASVKFEWFDGLLVQAVERGNWLILDNANLCSPSVLDRLNSLLETNGTLIVNECSLEDGSPRVIQPHPNFRLFLTVDPKYGELSRAMRNRGIEVYMGPLHERATAFDATVLGLSFKADDELDLVDQMKSLYVEDSSYKPSTAFVSAGDSKTRVFSLITDIVNVSEEENKKELFDTILGLLPFAVLSDIEKWKDTVLSSKEFDFTNKALVEEMFKSLHFLHEEGLLDNISDIYKPLVSVGTEVAAISQHFMQYQNLHPLINPFIEAHFLTSHPYVESPEPAYFLEVVSNILEASVLLDSIESKAMNGKISDLSYVERSAAFHLGRDLKKRPRLDIFKLIQGISQYIKSSFREGNSDLLYSTESFYQSLFDLQLIWKGLLNTAATEDESKVRVFQFLIEKWQEKYSSLKFNSVYSEEFSQLLTSFGSGLKLTSGFSMERIWEKFRREYPLNEESWRNAELLFKLTTDFDSIVKEQFQDSNDLIRSLRTLILELYRDILADKVNQDDFGTYFNELSSGIQKLRDVSSTFIDKRQNTFEHEFTLLSNFIEVLANIESKDCTESLFSIANNSTRPTFSLLKSTEGNLFSPYPSIFDSLWISKENYSQSLVSGLFSNELVTSSLSKANGFLKNSGKYLQQNLDDINYLSKNLIINSNNILTNQKKNFKALLVLWFKDILDLHSTDSIEVEKLLLLEDKSFEEIVEKLINIIKSIDNPEFVHICEQFIVPSLVLLIQGNNLGDLGRAWVLFSCGAIQLYVPSSAFDPAIKEHILYDQFTEQQNLSKSLNEAWGSVRFVISGEEKIHAEKVLPVIDDTSIPEKPRVYRKSGNMEELFEEWKAFMESTIDIKPLTELLDSAQTLSEKSSKMIDIFQHNSDHFMMRLKNNFSIYSDINDILKGYIFGLKLGFDLISMETKSATASVSVENTWPVNFVRLTDFNDIQVVFNELKNLNKGHGVDSIAPEFTMTFFTKLCFAHNNHKDDPSLDSILHQSFQMLYYRWSLRRMKAEDESQQQGSLYKYSDPTTDIEGDFKSLFPDYEDVMDTNMDSVKKNDSFEDIYYVLANIYITAFTTGDQYEISSIIQQGSELFDVLAKLKDDFKVTESNKPVFNSLVYLLDSSVKTYTSKDEKLDFYRGYSPSESKKAIRIVTGIRNSLMRLLAEWPEHATLQNIHRASEDFLLFPMNYPISRLLQKIEQIYTYIAEWEKYASSQVTLKVHFEELTSLIVSWRKLELSTWNTLFEHEDSVLEKNMSKWWFHLFETIIVPNFTEEEPEDASVAKLLSAINIFLGQTTYGEFEPRMKLLTAFKNHIQILMPNGVIFNSLANILQFYQQFMPVIKENIMNTRKTLEKDVSEVILLASWKDVNIDALKQSARRSHNNLYKIVRKYRSLLSKSVMLIIESGISSDFAVTVQMADLPLIKGQVMPDNLVQECSEISTWLERPARLRNISLIEKNMEVYISRVSNEVLPSLYDFAKELMDEMDRLRKETPNELKETNKKLVSALKTQKRKLLSDTLREVRRIGLKTNIKANVHQVQATTNSLLIHCKNFNGTLLETVDFYFFRVIDLLPRLRASVSNGVAEDVPQVDAEKALAALENLVFSLVTTKEPLIKFANSFSEINELFKHFEHIAMIRDTDLFLEGAKKHTSIEFNLKNIQLIMNWLPKLLDFSIEVISSTSKYQIDNSTEVFTKAKLKLLDFKHEFEHLKLGLFTTATSSFIDTFSVFYASFMENLTVWKQRYPQLSFVSDSLSQWIENLQFVPSVTESESNDNEFKVLEDLEKSYRELSNAVLVSIQKVTECQTETITEETDDWLSLTQKRYMKYINSTHHKSIVKRMKLCLELISQIQYDNSSSNLASSLTAFTLPFFRHYIKLISVIFKNVRNSYKDLSHSAYILSHSLYVLATKGFCSPEPPSEQKDLDNLQDGTGLGDGEGATNNSNDVEDDEDLSEQAQQPNEDQKDRDDGEEENDDAVDIEGDMAGNLEEASDQDDDDDEDRDEEENELDEEIDDIDDLDPNAVDEKMWDEEAKEDNKEKDSDKLPENSNNDEEMEANESENENDNDDNKPKDKNDDSNNDENVENDEQEEEDAEDGEEGEDKDVGEQEDEVKNEENEQLEQNVPETETLELPEDMNLDGDDEEKDVSDKEDEELDDSLDDKLDMESEEKQEKQEDAEEDAKDAENNEEQEDEEKEGEENINEPELNEGEGKGEDDENVENESEDEALGEKNEEDHEGGMDMQEDEDEAEAAEGVDGANEESNEDIDKDSAVKQESGEKGDGADNQVSEENNDVGATGGAATEQEDMKDPESKNQDDARDMAKESLKQLGDSLKEFHRRRQEIQEASIEEKEEKTDEAANQRPDEFQHVEGENAEHDTQALGAADKDQIQSLNEENAIDDMEEDYDEEMKEENQEPNEVEDMEVDENEEQEQDAEADENFEGKTKSALMGERNKLKEEEDFVIGNEFNEIETDEETSETNLNMDINELDDIPPMELETARNLWRNSELATQELASGLCEQLRLILEPTLATKLRGDYKTGKRLNMKRIIPYIASEFRKDKIWLRRTKPSKRQYQIMIAVDDSKSMSESKSTELAFHSIALVSKALSQLESGGLSIVRFGEDVRVVHPFDKPFNSQESGSRIFQWFDFQQTRTDVKELCNKSLSIFENARATSNSDLWQLQIIISDGVCEDHETVQRLVRKAREEKVMLVFVVLDGINASESILDMSQVSYVPDANTGQLTLQVNKYLDSFPFEFYAVVKNINELPEMLALILRQYFSEIARV